MEDPPEDDVPSKRKPVREEPALEITRTNTALMTLSHKAPDPEEELEIQKQDAVVIHHSLLCIADAWNGARSVDDVCKLAMTTGKMLQLRRTLLLGSSKKGAGIFDYD